jgi:hypothetical protein
MVRSTKFPGFDALYRIEWDIFIDHFTQYQIFRKNKHKLAILLDFPLLASGWQELDASSRRSSEMARNWRDLCPAVDCSGLV